MSILITAGIAIALVAILDLISEGIMRMALGVAFGIPTALLNSTTTTFVLDDGNGGGLLNILPSIEGFDVLKVFKIIGWAILIGGILVSLLKSLTAVATGEAIRSPGQVIFNGVLSILLMIAVFGIGNYQGLIYYFGTLMDNCAKLVTNGMIGSDGQLALKVDELKEQLKVVVGQNALIGDISDMFTGNIEDNGIIKLIFCIGLATGVIGAGIVHVERFLSLILYLLFGPICLGFNSLDETKETSKQWFLGIVTQTLVILLSFVLWRLFFNAVVMKWTILNMAITLGIISLIKNSEKFLNSVGLRTMPNQDTASAFLGAAGSAYGTLLMGLNMASNLANGGGEAFRDWKTDRDNKDRNFLNDVTKARLNHDQNAEKLAIDRYTGKTKSNGASRNKLGNKLNGTAQKEARANKLISNLENNYGLPKAEEMHGKYSQSIGEQTKNAYMNANSFNDFEKASQNFKSAQAKNSSIPNMTYTDGQAKAIGQSLDRVYQNQIARANGDQSLINQANSDYKSAYSSVFGIQPTNTPYVASATSNAYKADSGFKMSIETPNYASNSIKESVGSFNDVLSQPETFVKAGVAGSALALERSGYSESGALSAVITAPNGNQVNTAMMSIRDGDGNQQMCVVLPSDYSVPANSYASANVKNMNYAHYELDTQNSIAIGDGSISLVPIERVPLNSDQEQALIDSGIIEEQIGFIDERSVEGSEFASVGNSDIRDADMAIHNTFNEGSLPPVQTKEETIEELTGYANDFANKIVKSGEDNGK